MRTKRMTAQIERLYELVDVIDEIRLAVDNQLSDVIVGVNSTFESVSDDLMFALDDVTYNSNELRHEK